VRDAVRKSGSLKGGLRDGTGEELGAHKITPANKSSSGEGCDAGELDDVDDDE